jgi:hypothetical protein
MKNKNSTRSAKLLSSVLSLVLLFSQSSPLFFLTNAQELPLESLDTISENTVEDLDSDSFEESIEVTDEENNNELDTPEIEVEDIHMEEINFENCDDAGICRPQSQDSIDFTIDEVTEIQEPARIEFDLSNIPESIERVVTLLPDTSDWIEGVDFVTTKDPVELGKIYTYRFENDQILKIEFTKLPEAVDTVSIRQLKLSTEEANLLGAASQIAYEVISPMQNSSFEYMLALPLEMDNQSIQTQNIVLKSANSLDDLLNQNYTIEEEAQITNSQILLNADHFTVFVVVNPPADPTNQMDCDAVELGSAASSTCFATIQTAIDAAAADPATPHTITIASGIFDEKLIIKSSNLTLQGQGDTTIISPPLDNSDAITFNGSHTNVILQNFKIERTGGRTIRSGIRITNTNINGLRIENITINGNGGGASAHGGIYVNGNVNGVTITNNRVSNFAVASSRGIVLWNGFKQNITITGNTVENVNCCGIELQDGTASGFNMSNNTIIGASDSSMSVIGANNLTGANTISSNTIVTSLTGRFGIEIKGGSYVNVSSNTIIGSAPSDTRDRAAIAVGNINSAGCPSNITVSSNIIDNIKQPNAGFTGFGISISGSDSVVSSNTITNSDIAINVQQGFLGTQATIDTPPDDYFGRDNCATTTNILIDANSFAGNSEDIQILGGAGVSVFNEILFGHEVDTTYAQVGRDGIPACSASDVVYTNQNAGGKSRQVLEWTPVAGATTYEFRSFSWNGTNWAPTGASAASISAAPDNVIAGYDLARFADTVGSISYTELDTTNNVFRYITMGTAEGIYTRAVKAYNGVILVGESTITETDLLNPAGYRNTLNVCSKLVIDRTKPLISFVDDVLLGPVTNDSIQIITTDANFLNSSYGFSSDSTCDSTDSYPYNFDSGDTIDFLDGSNNGMYVCIKSIDKAGNIEYQASANPLNIDITGPIATVSFSKNPIRDGNIASGNRDQTVTLTYNEPMDVTSTPIISFSPTVGVWTSLGDGAWFDIDVDGNFETWVETFRIQDKSEEVGGVSVASTGAKDLLGNTEQASVSATFDVDTKNPILSWTSPTSPYQVRGSALNLEVSASDIMSGIDFVRLRYRALGSTTWQTILEDTISPYIATFDITELADGKYELRARAQDNVGNATVVDIQITIDNTAPIITIDTLRTTNRRPQITGTIDDPTANIELEVGGIVYYPTNNGDGTWTLPANTLPTISLGTYDLVATAEDTIGNQATDITTNELQIYSSGGSSGGGVSYFEETDPTPIPTPTPVPTPEPEVEPTQPVQPETPQKQILYSSNPNTNVYTRQNPEENTESQILGADETGELEINLEDDQLITETEEYSDEDGEVLGIENIDTINTDCSSCKFVVPLTIASLILSMIFIGVVIILDLKNKGLLGFCLVIPIVSYLVLFLLNPDLKSQYIFLNNSCNFFCKLALLMNILPTAFMAIVAAKLTKSLH